MQHRGNLLGLLLVGTSGLTMAQATNAAAIEHATRFYNIPAQPMASALNNFAEMSGVDLVVSAQTVKGKKSHAVRGNYSPDAALDQLLRGSALRHRTSGGGSVIVETPAAARTSAAYSPDDPIQLAQNEQQPSQPVATADQPAQQQSTVPGGGSDIVITGVRASLQRARDIKRNSTGVVDAVSAEDIGKFPDTNLAESLQRIPGVSIERRNGEGSFVTVRGFGPEYNMVTINGRQLATTDINVVGGNDSVDFTQPQSRAFDFSNLSPDGIARLEVYKTGRAAEPSGGIGATINIVTLRPLDTHQSGFRGSLSAKAQWDTSLHGHKITPNLSGVMSWSDPQNTFGISVYGSYEKRLSAAASATSNDWNVITYQQFLDGAGGMYAPGHTVVNNPPANPNEYISVPNDSRYHYSTDREERINGSATAQWRPTETMLFTLDGLYAQNRVAEQRTDQTNWFNRPFDTITFDGDPVEATAINMSEGSLYGVKDIDWEQQYRSSKTNLYSVGLNYKWNITDQLTLSLDGNTSRSKSGPDSKNGTTSTLFNLGANVVDSHSVDWTGPVPHQQWVLNDCVPNATEIYSNGINGNCNNQLDLGDVGTGIGRTNTDHQTHRVNQFSANLAWNFGQGVHFDVGGSYIDSNMTTSRLSTQQTLGNWGVNDVGLVKQLAGNIVQTFCLQCEFNHYTVTDAQTAFRANAIDLTNIFSPYYINLDAQNGTSLHQIGITNNNFDQVQEKVTAVYAQLSWNGEFAGKPTQLVGGVRWENTKVNATSLIAIPTAIVWESDNDFTFNVSNTQTPVYGKGEYNNILPQIDFSIEPSQGLKARVSYSKTIARPNYNYLFAEQAVAGAPNRPGALGGVATGTAGNPDLKPLTSDNLDLSFEYYYGRSNYVAVGLFAKKVNNFIGQAQIQQPLFGLTDPSSGAPGTLSGTALSLIKTNNIVVSDVTLFTMSALLQQNGGTSAAAQTAALAQFQSHYNAGTSTLDQNFVNQVLAAVDILGTSSDPLEQFSVTTPVNNQTANVHGIELQGQHFFGDTGFGIAASATKVLGDVHWDRASNPNTNVFAVTGLSDSANVTAIYEKYGISARISYNWRGRFLDIINFDSYHSGYVLEPFGTLDGSITYNVTPHAQITLEAQNLTSTPIRAYGRSTHQLWFAQELHPRFWLGARWQFGGNAAPPPPPPPPLPPPPPPPATQTCPDGSVIPVTESCPAPPPPPPPPPPPATKGERGQ